MKHISIIILITSVVVCGALAGITAAAKMPSEPAVLPSPTPEATPSQPVQELNRIGFYEGAGGNYTKNGDMLYFIQEDGAIAGVPVGGRNRSAHAGRQPIMAECYRKQAVLDRDKRYIHHGAAARGGNEDILFECDKAGGAGGRGVLSVLRRNMVLFAVGRTNNLFITAPPILCFAAIL